MSTYIFILCMELISSYTNYLVDIPNWDSIELSKNGPVFSHLFFANDLTLIARQTLKLSKPFIEFYQPFSPSLEKN